MWKYKVLCGNIHMNLYVHVIDDEKAKGVQNIEKVLRII